MRRVHRNRAILAIIAVVLSLAPVHVAVAAHPRGFAYCRMQGSPGWSRADIENEIACATAHFPVPGGYGTVLAIALRETGNTLDPYAYNRTGCGGHGCLGLFQHSAPYWPGRVADFRAHRPRFGVSTRWYNVRAMVLTSTWMMWHYGCAPWGGCP